MAKRKSLHDDACPVARSLDLIGDRWSLLLVRDAFDGIRRFSDFQRNLAVARNILSDRLGALVAAGVLAVRPASDGTAYQEYVLTPRGEQLFPVIVALRQWGEQQLFAPGEPHSQLLTAQSQQPLAPMWPSNPAGQVVQSHHTFVKKLSA